MHRPSSTQCRLELVERRDQPAELRDLAGGRDIGGDLARREKGIFGGGTCDQESRERQAHGSVSCHSYLKMSR